MQALITWVIVGIALLFVIRWIYKKIKGEPPTCCITDGEDVVCSSCTVIKDGISGKGNKASE